tara:strand:+ start:773 stop:1243 length:471 start_codon:yes stop_codon:yes gene_type:complete
MKKVQTLQEIEFSSMVSSGKEYLCIEEIDKGTYLIDFRYRETIGEFDELFDKHMLELEQKHGKEFVQNLYDTGEAEEIEIKIPKEINGKKIVEIQDGEYYLGEKLISDTQQRNIIFHELTDRVVDNIWNIILDKQHENQGFWDKNLLTNIKKYTEC